VSIRLDARELQQVLALTPPEQNIMLVGRHGIGKSQIITHFYEQQGRRVIAFFLGQMSDPGDLIGLMDKDLNSGRSVFLPPYWWPREDEPICLFLDELNRARPEILQSVHDLALNRTLAGKRLPPGSVVISAVNQGEQYQLTDLDPALVSRFNLYEFAPTVEDWLLWAHQNGVDPRVIAFIQKMPQHLEGEVLLPEDAWQAAGLVKQPDRRAWVRVSDFVKPHLALSDIHLKGIAGMVGTPAALAFRQSLGSSLKVSPEQVLYHFERHGHKLKEMSLQELVLLNEQILFWLNSKKIRADQAEGVRENLLAYLKALKQLKQNEVLAHLASQMENPKFEQAGEFLAISLPIVTFLSDYIQGIQV
jgi:hypothetical protein